MAASSAALYLFQRRLLYRPGRTRPELADLATLGVREVETTTADSLTLFSWYLPPCAGRPVIAYFHGNGGHIGYRAERLRRFAQGGYGVLLAEYRGYAGNPGRLASSGSSPMARRRSIFSRRAGIAPADIVLWGESLGSGVAVYLAAEREVAGVILEAPFTSVAAAAQHHYPFVPAAMLVHDRFDLLAAHRRGHRAALGIARRARHDRAGPPWPRPARRRDRAKGGLVRSRSRPRNLAQFGALEVAIAFIERRVRPPETEPVAAGRIFD